MWLRRSEDERLGDRRQFGDFVGKYLPHLFFGYLLVEAVFGEGRDQLCGRGRTEIGGDQLLFKLVQQGAVSFRFVKTPVLHIGELGGGAAEPRAQDGTSRAFRSMKASVVRR